MSNTFLNGLKKNTNFGFTENGAVKYNSTNSALLDLFALGGAYRKRSEEDIITLFSAAYQENSEYAMKCLFYLRDVLEGQGERRFFRVCMKWLANSVNMGTAVRNMKFIPSFGRWDDLYTFVGTSLEEQAMKMIKQQLLDDIVSDSPSLCAKWVKSINASSAETRRLAEITMKYCDLSSAKKYRKILSYLRKKINILERLMSAQEWEEIDFGKIPSKAGLNYSRAFIRHPEIAEQYRAFLKNKNTKVNAKALYPYEVVEKALQCSTGILDDPARIAINKYWDNLPNWLKDANFNGICVCDTSGSMIGRPINVAISLSLYCAERAGGPFANHYISFASRPQLIETKGIDFVNKVRRIYETNLIDNTNIEAVFDLLLNTAIQNNCSQDEIPQNVVIVSDMQIDAARGIGRNYNYHTGRWENNPNIPMETLMESIRKKWAANGYRLPHLVYWNVDARDNTILDGGENVTYVSGFSPSIFRSILTNKNSVDLMYEVLDNERYVMIH